MITYINYLISILGSPEILLVIKSIAFILKSISFCCLLHSAIRLRISSQLMPIISLVLGANAFVDFSWLPKLARLALFPFMSYTAALFFVRLAWICSIAEYLGLSFLIEQLSSGMSPPRLTVTHITTIIIGILLALAQSGIIIIYFFSKQGQRPDFEFTIYQTIYFYVLFVLIWTFYRAYKSYKKKNMPKILAAQFKILIGAFIVPHVILEFGAYNPFAFSHDYKHSIYPLISISTLLFTYALYFSVRRMLGLRFLNIKNHVETKYDSNFIIEFKNILDQFAHISTLVQVKHIVQTFFKTSLSIPKDKVQLYLRQVELTTSSKDLDPLDPLHHHMQLCVENMLTQLPKSEEIKQILYQSKIFIKDELEYTNFYEGDEVLESIIQLLKTMEADVFVPVYEKRTIIGYIIIESDARPNSFFSAVDRDEMVIFATYLGNIIKLLHHGNYTALIKEQKDLKEELFLKHQEINQYKESLRSFLRTRDRKIGIVFYKNRRFSYGNQAARELIGVDLNMESGHELTQTFKKITKNVQEYKTLQTVMAKDVHGKKLVIAGIPSLEENYIIIVVYYPEIADTLKDRLELLKDPSEWDYALYLETTTSGQLIHTLIPGSGEVLLNFKINLLKASLSRKAIVLDMPQEDIQHTVEIIHHISMRSKLHILRLTSPEKNHEVALKLFGINPLFGASNEEQPLLEHLNTIGTLFIENVHLLGIETQNMLAEFISFGYFRPLRSDKKIMSNIRIICSTPQNLTLLTQAGTFSASLLQELTKTTLTLPPLISLQQQELHDLMDGYLEQALESTELKNLLELTTKERERIINQKPLSLQDFKEHIQISLNQKTTKKKIKEITFDPTYAITDPELHQAIRLGKRALKDNRLMIMLWNKFKNQTKIAELLGVNRSSVNRRCKEFNLID